MNIGEHECNYMGVCAWVNISKHEWNVIHKNFIHKATQFMNSWSHENFKLAILDGHAVCLAARKSKYKWLHVHKQINDLSLHVAIS